MTQLASLRSKLAPLVPEWLLIRHRLRRMIRERRHLGRLKHDAAALLPPRRLFILPPDTHTLVGSRGDEAMMCAVANSLRRRRADLAVSVLAASECDEAAVRRLGFVAARYQSHSFRSIVEAVWSSRPDAFVVIGADMMDGFYSPLGSAMRLLTAELLACCGVPTVITGFSFNGDPDPLLAPLFNALDPRVQLFARDPLSLSRLQAFCRARATLVSDPAFLLEPDTSSPPIVEVIRWIEMRRRHGDRVFALNVHPALLRGASDETVQRLMNVAASALIETSASNNISWLLLAHDFRGVRGCSTSLAMIEDIARERLGERLLRPMGEFCAAELKGIAGLLDGVVAGRMHLAIAALGQGTPVACLTYQGKFEGMLAHFGLPNALALSPEEALRDGAFHALLRDFVARAADHRLQVAKRLPGVMSMAEQNLVPLFGHGEPSARQQRSGTGRRDLDATAPPVLPPLEAR